MKKVFYVLSFLALSVVFFNQFGGQSSDVSYKVGSAVESVEADVHLKMPDLTMEAYGLKHIIVNDYKVPDSTAHQMVHAIWKNGDKLGLDPFLIAGVMAHESSFRPLAFSAGDAGLMQVNLRWHGSKFGQADPFDIESNIEIGSALLKQYIDKEGSISKGLLAYNGKTKSKVAQYKRNFDKSYPGIVLSLKKDFRSKVKLV